MCYEKIIWKYKKAILKHTKFVFYFFFFGSNIPSVQKSNSYFFFFFFAFVSYFLSKTIYAQILRGAFQPYKKEQSERKKNTHTHHHINLIESMRWLSLLRNKFGSTWNELCLSVVHIRIKKKNYVELVFSPWFWMMNKTDFTLHHYQHISPKCEHDQGEISRWLQINSLVMLSVQLTNDQNLDLSIGNICCEHKCLRHDTSHQKNKSSLDIGNATELIESWHFESQEECEIKRKRKRKKEDTLRLQQKEIEKKEERDREKERVRLAQQK